jgi:hypothetical protein
VARIELNEFRGRGEIATFTIDGIFIDRSYRLAQVGGTPVAGSWMSRYQDAALFVEGAFGYETTTNNALYDIINETGNLLNDRIVASPTDQVWSYNLFAEHISANATGTRMPSIVVRMSNVRLEGETAYLPNPQFITIRGFTNVDTQQSLTGIHARHVYSVNVVEFTEQNLSSRPNENLIDVNVRVTLALWNGVPIVVPGFHQPNPLSKTFGCGVQSVQDRTFTLGAAVTGNCFLGVMHYLWEESTNGMIWTPAEGVNNQLNFTAPILTQSTYFRRRATCGCGASIVTHPARVTMPERFPAYRFPYTMEINGVVWATRDVDLSRPTGFVYHPVDIGQKFRWNSLLGAGSIVGSDVISEWDVANDPCRQIGDGNTWRIATMSDFRLLAAAGTEWRTPQLSADAGFGCMYMRVFGTAPNQIFMPGGKDMIGNCGDYWTANAICPDTGTIAGGFLQWDAFAFSIFPAGWIGIENFFTYPYQGMGLRVRCVRED